MPKNSAAPDAATNRSRRSPPASAAIAALPAAAPRRQVLADEQWKTVQEEDRQNEEVLTISKQILDLTKEVHAHYGSASGPPAR